MWLHRGVVARPDPVRAVGPALLLVAAAGLVVACAGPWRPGLIVTGVTLGVTALFRLLAPRVPMATLSVRSGWLDAAFLAVTGAVLVVAALALP